MFILLSVSTCLPWSKCSKASPSFSLVVTKSWNLSYYLCLPCSYPFIPHANPQLLWNRRSHFWPIAVVSSPTPIPPPYPHQSPLNGTPRFAELLVVKQFSIFVSKNKPNTPYVAIRFHRRTNVSPYFFNDRSLIIDVAALLDYDSAFSLVFLMPTAPIRRTLFFLVGESRNRAWYISKLRHKRVWQRYS